MATVKNILDYLCTIAPLDLQLEYDNSGFLLGRSGAQVEKALLALDITEEVIQEAVEQDVQLIISHHPVIWGSLKAVTDLSGSEKLLCMAENHIAAISMHTNLDIGQGGVNDALIELLGAKAEDSLDSEGCGRVGRLNEPVSFERFLILCREKLKTKGLRYYDAGREVQKIAVLGGSGGGALTDAMQKGCDTFVTADIKYSQFLKAKELGINLIDGDHFCTENPIIPVLAEKLRKEFGDVRFIISERHGQVISFA